MAEFDSVVPAGSSGRLSARVATTSTQSGRISKSIAVTTDSPEAGTFRLRFVAELHMPVAIRPTRRFTINLIEGAAGSSRLLLSRGDGQPLRILGSTLGVEGLVVHAHPVRTHRKTSSAKEAKEPATPWGQQPPQKTELAAKSGDVWLELESSPSLAPGTYAGKLQLATDHPDAPEIQLPYTVRVRPLIETLPQTVRLWSSAPPPDPGRSAILTLRHNGGRSFEITGVEVSHPQLFSAVGNPRPAATQQTVRVRLADEADGNRLGGGIEGLIRITTDDEQRPLVEVPVLLAPSRLLSQRPVRHSRAGPATVVER